MMSHALGCLVGAEESLDFPGARRTQTPAPSNLVSDLCPTGLVGWRIFESGFATLSGNISSS